jgi:hypothetical protein
MTSGNLGLTDGEETDIVAFLPTLSDGFTRSYINSRSLGSEKIRIIVNCAARPRDAGGQTSATIAAPGPHSAPNPRPEKKRKVSREQ